MGTDVTPPIPPELDQETRRALRGVQLYHSGNEAHYFRPVVPGDSLRRTYVVADVQDKTSEFAGRSVIVHNDGHWFDDRGVVATVRKWFVHAERRRTGSGGKYAKDQPARYDDEQLAEIEACYDAEEIRGDTPRYVEDVAAGMPTPTLVKGPLTVTDMINFHMGGGWYGYGNPAFRLGYENRKKLRGFYTRNEHNAWDVVQRVHWDAELARAVGVPSTYDIGPMRWSWLVHYCTNWASDEGWLYRLRGEFRRFNYMGDTTWITAEVTTVDDDAPLGPRAELALTATNQRGQVNAVGTATVLLPSRRTGPVALPEPPPLPPHRSTP